LRGQSLVAKTECRRFLIDGQWNRLAFFGSVKKSLFAAHGRRDIFFWDGV
jgi:hypothetical protein